MAALHARYRVSFKRHAFLLKVIQFNLPEAAQLDGPFDVKATLVSQSSNAFAYQADASGADQTALAAQFIIGTQGYDDLFQKRTFTGPLPVSIQTIITDL